MIYVNIDLVDSPQRVNGRIGKYNLAELSRLRRVAEPAVKQAVTTTHDLDETIEYHRKKGGCYDVCKTIRGTLSARVATSKSITSPHDLNADNRGQCLHETAIHRKQDRAMRADSRARPALDDLRAYLGQGSALEANVATLYLGETSLGVAGD